MFLRLGRHASKRRGGGFMGKFNCCVTLFNLNKGAEPHPLAVERLERYFRDDEGRI